MAKNISHLDEMDIHVQKPHRNPNKKIPKRSTLKHVIINMVKIKEIILKAARKKSYIQGQPHKAISYFFFRKKNIQAKME